MNFVPEIIIFLVLIVDLVRRIINIGHGSLKKSGILKVLFWIEFILTGILINFISITFLLLFVFFLLFIWHFLANAIVYFIFKKLGYSSNKTKSVNKFDSTDIDALTKNFKSELRKNKNDNITINKILDVFINEFKNINSMNDLFSYLPRNSFKDITETDEIKMLNKISNKSFEKKYDNFSNKYFKFNESKSQIGELDIDFVDFSLANVRIQLFDNDYTINKIKHYIDNLIFVNWDNDKISLKSNTYKYLGETENGLDVGIREKNNSVSIHITDKKYT
ncbi:hypothetical protein [Halanaerobium sp. MA284_MarDTE_T2]|uniref:hypothetical protein n=1 Tax=Halanaerobium sp. MA284_MarDTE_T2 TaxID=2183913 RepID=UPI000DF3F028|nr:hypothetical protein [Halanaerobium sp. MA284_MarDTE_T2]RCW48190.1 hypothetical protein DFR78_11045 [Halanaerobium sp. MA284_MarDTE_T2]